MKEDTMMGFPKAGPAQQAMADGRIVCRDVKVGYPGKYFSDAVVSAAREALSLVRNAPGYGTSSDRLRVWLLAHGPKSFEVFAVKGEYEASELFDGNLMYDGPFASAEETIWVNWGQEE